MVLDAAIRLLGVVGLIGTAVRGGLGMAFRHGFSGREHVGCQPAIQEGFDHRLRSGSKVDDALPAAIACLVAFRPDFPRVVGGVNVGRRQVEQFGRAGAGEP